MNILHMIGNTHFDPAWLWTWDEAMASVRATFRAALERMKEDDGFVYSFSTPAVFEWIERVDPELFSEIQARVREGRWEIESEGWWLQPDCNAPSGESLIRQGLYGQAYLAEKFGKRASAVFNIDSFGHSAMLPQILKKSGISSYVFSRPAAPEGNLPDELFMWHSPDGSEVTTFRAGSAGGELYPQDTAECIRKCREAMADMSHDMMAVYGVTDHGGAPTKRAIADVRTAGPDVRFSGVQAFFEAQKGRVSASYEGELQPPFYGPFSDCGEIKRNNRRGEYALDRAEKSGWLARRFCGRPFPSEALRRLWKDLLFNQFHDILGGTSIPGVFGDARNLHGRVLQSANEMTHFALQSIAAGIRTFGDNKDSVWNLVVFNLNGSRYRAPLEAEVQWAWEFPWYQGGIELVDEAGNAYPAQIVTEESKIPGFRSRFVFSADVPALGWKVWAVRKTGADAARDFSETDVLSPFAFRVFEDAGDVWCFNSTDGFGAACEEPRLIERRTVEKGPILTTVKQVWQFRRSVLEEYITLYAETGMIDYRFRVNWNEPHAVLKLIPAFDVSEGVRAACPAGSVCRPADGKEYPAGEWLSCGGNTLLLDGVHAYDTADGQLRLTVLRSPIFGDLRIGELNPDLDYRYMEQGLHEGRIRVLPEALSPAEAQKQAMHWNNPPIVVCEANHPGTLPAEAEGLRLSGDAVVTALKPAEDGDGWALRLIEYDGKAETVHICLGERAFDARMQPYEIKTLRFRDDGSVEETDLLEE